MFTGLRSYLIIKHYNQPFEDIVPLILVNGFNVSRPVVILYGLGDGLGAN